MRELDSQINRLKLQCKSPAIDKYISEEDSPQFKRKVIDTNVSKKLNFAPTAKVFTKMTNLEFTPERVVKQEVDKISTKINRRKLFQQKKFSTDKEKGSKIVIPNLMDRYDVIVPKTTILNFSPIVPYKLPDFELVSEVSISEKISFIDELFPIP